MPGTPPPTRFRVICHAAHMFRACKRLERTTAQDSTFRGCGGVSCSADSIEVVQGIAQAHLAQDAAAAVLDHEGRAEIRAEEQHAKEQHAEVDNGEADHAEADFAVAVGHSAVAVAKASPTNAECTSDDTVSAHVPPPPPHRHSATAPHPT